MLGIPGTKPRTSPPRTSRIGYGTLTTRASTASPAIATSRPKMMSSRCSMANVGWVRSSRRRALSRGARQTVPGVPPSTWRSCPVGRGHVRCRAPDVRRAHWLAQRPSRWRAPQTHYGGSGLRPSATGAREPRPHRPEGRAPPAPRPASATWARLANRRLVGGRTVGTVVWRTGGSRRATVGPSCAAGPGAPRLMAVTASKLSADSSARSPVGPMMPALLNAMSSRPKVATVRSTIAATSPRLPRRR